MAFIFAGIFQFFRIHNVRLASAQSMDNLAEYANPKLGNAPITELLTGQFLAELACVEIQARLLKVTATSAEFGTSASRMANTRRK